MSLDNWISLISALIAFAGLLFVVRQLRDGNQQQEMASLIEIFDTNRELLSLGFEHPQLFAVLRDTKNADPEWERRYLQLWLNQMSLIHSCLKRSVFESEVKSSLESQLAEFLTLQNMREHWQKHGAFYPVSFQVWVNGLIQQPETPATDVNSVG